MGITSATNKRRRTPLIDNVLIRNFIYTTLLTVKYNKEAYARLKKETETTSIQDVMSWPESTLTLPPSSMMPSGISLRLITSIINQVSAPC